LSGLRHAPARRYADGNDAAIEDVDLGDYILDGDTELGTYSHNL